MADDNEILYISLEKLIFDPQNPRLPPDLNKSNIEEILKYMLRDASLLELMKSIAESGYSRSEPLLVVPANKNEYTVVEGNRRLAALKILSNPSLATVRQKSVEEIVNSKKNSPNEIPCILHKNRDDILDYLGYRHITGVKSWGVLEKARYVEQLFKKHKIKGPLEENYKILASMIGSRADHVGRLLSSLKLYELANDKSYFDIKINEKEVDFSILYTAVGYNNIREHIGLERTGDIELNQINLKNFEFIFRCLYDPSKKIEESRELADLNSVVGNKRALSEYKKGTPLSEAIYYTDAPLETFITFLNGAKKYLSNARNCLDKLEPPENADEIILQVRELEKIAKSIRKTLEEDED
ncbi:hypothetical protein R84B8_00221 [Treponema sp. R8-4-B8]